MEQNENNGEGKDLLHHSLVWWSLGFLLNPHCKWSLRYLFPYVWYEDYSPQNCQGYDQGLLLNLYFGKTGESWLRWLLGVCSVLWVLWSEWNGRMFRGVRDITGSLFVFMFSFRLWFHIVGVGSPSFLWALCPCNSFNFFQWKSLFW